MTCMLKSESDSVITARCGATFRRPPNRKDRPAPSPFADGKVTAWSSDVTCTGCRS